MDIAALSLTMNQAKLMQNVSLAVTKVAIEHQYENTAQLVVMLDAPHPTKGQLVDIEI